MVWLDRKEVLVSVKTRVKTEERTNSAHIGLRAPGSDVEWKREPFAFSPGDKRDRAVVLLNPRDHGFWRPCGAERRAVKGFARGMSICSGGALNPALTAPLPAICPRDVACTPDP